MAEFLARHVTPYDPATDDYERPPFAEDIKEGKNDPIYNAHSYHTKVPPRSIIPSILHYTNPGDVVLDPFCGSGMTGVAAQMCANPPEDLLAQFPDLKGRVGPRFCILNDLSPAACHIAYNYNTPVDVEALRSEFDRIKAAVKDEFDWLYGTEHYEPAVGVYASKNPEVMARLKNPPSGVANTRHIDSIERTWELITRAEVESRLGYPVTELPRDKNWGELDVGQVDEWICIPATIQYTIWSDVYRCEGFVSVEQLTLPFIERVCSRYFRKFGQHWYLRGEAVGGNGSGGLFEEEVAIKDDVSAIDWLRQKVRIRSMLIGELKPLWMRSVGLLSAEVSQSLSLDELLTENFWRDDETNRWREPTDEERERMNNDRSIRVLHDADRYIAGTLRRTTTDAERCDWIDVLFKACRQVEEGDTQSTPTLRDFDLGEGYRLITRLFQSVLRDHVLADVFAKSQMQNSAASSRISQVIRQEEAEQKAERKRTEGRLFD